MIITDLYARFSGSDHPLIDCGKLVLNWHGFATLNAPSGLGKTTLFRLLSGWPWRSDTGIFRCGADFDREQDVRFIGAHRSLLPWKTVQQNLQNICSAYKSGDLIEVSLDKFVLSQYPYQLSLGMYKRVELLAAVYSQPKLLLLDEFFSSIGLPHRQRVRELLIQKLPDARIWVIAHEENTREWVGGPSIGFKMDGPTITQLLAE